MAVIDSINTGDGYVIRLSNYGTALLLSILEKDLQGRVATDVAQAKYLIALSEMAIALRDAMRQHQEIVTRLKW